VLHGEIASLSRAIQDEIVSPAARNDKRGTCSQRQKKFFLTVSILYNSFTPAAFLTFKIIL